MIRKWACVAAVGCGVLAGPAMADQLQLTGVIRDFKRGDQTGGHPDFETAGALGRFGHVVNMVTMTLSEDGKPVYNPNRGALYNAGGLSLTNKDTMKSQASFNQWFRDVPDVNASMPLTLTLDNGQSAPGGVYSYSSNAFWPIDNKLFGNQGLSRNFHFTFELKTKFQYVPGQYFTFIGDDDVWVYINGVRVIDLGGVHAAVTGSVLLFDGKAFVENGHFVTGGMVKTVSNSMASQLAKKWSDLGLPGSSPIASGRKYIDLNLTNGLADVRTQFNGTSVKVWASADLSNVVLLFADGAEQKFDNLSGTGLTFSGTGANAGKTITGCWVKTGPNVSGDGPGYGRYFSAAGMTSIEATLDFFFAERHTTQANFRIDTSINLKEVPPTTVSPLYD